MKLFQQAQTRQLDVRRTAWVRSQSASSLLAIMHVRTKKLRLTFGQPDILSGHINHKPCQCPTLRGTGATLSRQSPTFWMHKAWSF